ncbi:MAG: 2-amino-3,7-dideoxy-D-threo-hept-6-ulosonate synthase [Conexivisphaerales archaeon]
MTNGKARRLSRIAKDGKILCVPMDHGVSDGPINGIEDITQIVKKVDAGGASSVILHKGSIKALRYEPSLGIIMHMSASTSYGPTPYSKVIVSGIREAVFLGADAVSVHINVGADSENKMLKSLGAVADECDKYGIPLIAMMYVRGENVKDQYDPDLIKKAVRLGGELGADIVKAPYTGNIDTFSEVVRGSHVPVAIAGGPKLSNIEDVFRMAKDAMKAGAVGVTFGRNIFQDPRPDAVVRSLAKIIFDGSSIDNALRIYNEEGNS